MLLLAAQPSSASSAHVGLLVCLRASEPASQPTSQPGTLLSLPWMFSVPILTPLLVALGLFWLACSGSQFGSLAVYAGRILT